VRTAPRKNSGAVAPDNVGTPLAELISESNHFLCCGSAISLVPDDKTVPSNGHADLIWSPNELQIGSAGGSWRDHVIEPVEYASGQRSESRASVPWNVWE